MTTGEKVKQARIAKGLAQDYIAARLGISKSAVSRCELGQRQFRVDQLYTLANLLDVPPYELVNISPEKKEELKQISKIISNFEDRYYNGDYIGEADQWIPQSMEFLKQLIERELATAAAEPGPDGASSENSQEPELKKRRRRTAKFDTMFNQLNDAGQLNALEYLKIMVQVPTFQLHPQKTDVYSGLNEEEGAQLKSVIGTLNEVKYERFQLMEAHEPEDSEKMRENAEQIAGLNEIIAQIITGAIKRANPQN
nr:helix-turn-helix transcriptional regulator [uncultured Oscillibacter sp.]